MKIFPAIDIKDGKCVRLTKGDFKSEKIYNENPINQAEIFSNSGFKYLHIIDLDGALEGNLVNLKVVEDACMGIGASLRGKSPGTFGHISAFSLHPLKSLNAMGDGGAVVTNDKKMYDWLLKYRNHGMINRNTIEIWGINNRMQPLQCIVGLWGLKKIKKVIKIRNSNAEYYDKKLSIFKNFITIPKRIQGFTETYALYMVLCKNRDRLKSFLEKKNIEVKILLEY